MRWARAFVARASRDLININLIKKKESLSDSNASYLSYYRRCSHLCRCSWREPLSRERVARVVRRDQVLPPLRDEESSDGITGGSSSSLWSTGRKERKSFTRHPPYFKLNHTNTYLRKGGGLSWWVVKKVVTESPAVLLLLWSTGQEVRIRVKISLVNRVNPIRISLCRRIRLIHISEGGTSFLACVKKVLTETPAVLLLLCDQLDER